MPFDEATISGSARAVYIELGKHWSSQQVLAQANMHVGALKEHGAALVAHGFGAGDAGQLEDARDALRAAEAVRTRARGDRTAGSQAHRDALRAGGHERRSARTILGNAARALREDGSDAALEAARDIEGMLAQTARSPGRDGETMAMQLDVLRSKLGDPAVAAAAATRGGPQAVARLGAAIGKLRESTPKIIGRGTPEETELLHVLRGLVVTLTRSARKAAAEAADELGTPALLEAFELRGLYPARGGS